jgi:16S rRNA (uracil1498-N3)-methyltransferase
MQLKRFLCESLPSPGRSIQLSESDSNHALRVLRLNSGDCVQLLDGQGNLGVGIVKIKKNGVWVELTNKIDGALSKGRGVYPIRLEAAILKGDAMEWLVEKATELGVSVIQPLQTDHTVVDTKKKGSKHFVERWQKISDQALKQCGRLEKLKVADVLSIEELLQKYPSRAEEPRFWCLENSSSRLLNLALENRSTLLGASLLIGPEGGFSDREKDHLKRMNESDLVSLGPLVTRAETAALFGISLLRASFMKA